MICTGRFALPPPAVIIGFRYRQGRRAVTRNNILYLIIGALVVAVGVLSYQLYQDRHPPQGMSINFGPNGVSIQGGGK
jgi:hypothetical protein